MKVIKPVLHGYLDYIFAAALFALPSWLDFPHNASVISYVGAAGILGLSLLTAYPLGVIKSVPFPVHGTIEIVAGIFFLIAPWLFGFSGEETTRNAFVIVGVSVAALWALSDYRTWSASSIRYQFPESKDRLAA